jgi:glycosyltransferase involved in cell wall biosynthesis
MGDHIASLLLEPEKARAMGERGRQLVSEKFSSLMQLQNVESLYNELLKLSNPAWVSGVQRVDPNYSKR